MRQSGQSRADRYEENDQRILNHSEVKWRKTRQRGAEQAYWRGVDQADWSVVDLEERRRERIEDQIEKSRLDCSKQSRLQQKSWNKDIRVDWNKKIIKEGNQSCTRKILLGKGDWRASTQTASPDFIRAQSRNLGKTNGGVYDDDGVGDAGISNTAVNDVERRTQEMRNDGEYDRRDGRGDWDGDGRDYGTTETSASQKRKNEGL